MKTTMITFIILGLSLCNSAIAESEKKSATPEEIQARKEQFLKNTGGFVRKPNSGGGKVVFIDAQDRFAHEEIVSVATTLGDSYHIDVESVKKTTLSIADAKDAIKTTGAKAGVIATSLGSNEPALIVLPDECCALVNVAAFPPDAKSGLLRRQILRGFAAAAGAMTSQVNPSLMSSFSNTKKLESFPVEEVPADVALRVRTYLRTLGVVPYVTTTYKHAVREGWAPAPTNDVQQAIWDKVKAEQAQIPTKPLKITPDMKPQGK